jgi:hypothetical protein
MFKRSKWLVLWNVIITGLLVTAVVVNLAPAQADNVKVFSANGINDDGADGSATTVDDSIDSTTPDPLVTITTTGLSNKHSHICLVTGSAEATFVGTGVYIFGLSLDADAGTTASSDRRIEMFDNAGINDDTFEEVSSTIAYASLSPGDHTFTFSARKSVASNDSLNVSASSMTAVCMKKDL